MTSADADAQPIVIASRDAAQVAAIEAALGSTWPVAATADADDCRARAARCRLLLVDAAFASDEVAALVRELAAGEAPVVVLTAPDDVAGAAAALGAGAVHFVAKVRGYEALLETVVRNALGTIAERAAMEDSIASLQARVAELEQALGAPPSATPPAAGGEQARRQMVQRVVARLRSGEVNLPTCPEIHVRLRRLVDGGAGVHEVARLLTGDPGVAAGLLRMANSPYFRGARATSTLEEAIGRLGVATASAHVELIANRSLYATRRPHHRARLGHLWRHAIATAHAAQLLARALDLDDARLGTAGLLHDVGRLLLVQLVSEIEIEQHAPLEPADLDTLLQQHHADFGTALLRRWTFPDAMCRLVAGHEHPEGDDRELFVVHAADRLAGAVGHGSTEGVAPADDEVAAVVERLGLAAETLESIRSSVPAFVASCDAALGPAPGAK